MLEVSLNPHLYTLFFLPYKKCLNRGCKENVLTGPSLWGNYNIQKEINFWLKSVSKNSNKQHPDYSLNHFWFKIKVNVNSLVILLIELHYNKAHRQSSTAAYIPIWRNLQNGLPKFTFLFKKSICYYKLWCVSFSYQHTLMAIYDNCIWHFGELVANLY